MEKFVPDSLRAAAEIYEERNKMYRDNYKNFGKVWLALFPDGISTTSAEDPVAACNRLGIMVQMVGKLTRYAANFNRGGHDDSLDDLAVYTMMLKELDADPPEVCTHGTFGRFHAIFGYEGKG